MRVNARDLELGDWVRFNYHDKEWKGEVKEPKMGKFAFQDGWLLMTQDGYRHFKIRDMQRIELLM